MSDILNLEATVQMINNCVRCAGLVVAGNERCMAVQDHLRAAWAMTTTVTDIDAKKCDTVLNKYLHSKPRVYYSI